MELFPIAFLFGPIAFVGGVTNSLAASVNLPEFLLGRIAGRNRLSHRLLHGFALVRKLID
jgi:hypothetical protein